MTLYGLSLMVIFLFVVAPPVLKNFAHKTDLDYEL